VTSDVEPAIGVEFSWSMRESLLGAWEAVRSRPWSILVGAFCVIVAILGAAVEPGLAWVDIALTVVGVALGTGALHVLATWIALRRRPEMATATWHVEIRTSGLQVRSEFATSTIAWPAFRMIRETSHFLVFDSGADTTITLPKRAFSADQLQLLRARLGLTRDRR
jgi:YcxB-like protein